MKLERVKTGPQAGDYIFTGGSIPMELARKVWPDQYAASQAANAAGFAVYANGDCRPHDELVGPKPAPVTVSHQTYQAIVELDRALQAEFGADFAFVVMGRGHKLAASNLKDGILPPRHPNDR